MIEQCTKLTLHFFQVWADEGDSDDWQCVQTLGVPNKYYFLISFITFKFIASWFSYICSNECFFPYVM